MPHLQVLLSHSVHSSGPDLVGQTYMRAPSGNILKIFNCIPGYKYWHIAIASYFSVFCVVWLQRLCKYSQVTLALMDSIQGVDTNYSWCPPRHCLLVDGVRLPVTLTANR